MKQSGIDGLLKRHKDRTSTFKAIGGIEYEAKKHVYNNDTDKAIKAIEYLANLTVVAAHYARADEQKEFKQIRGF
jgi:hypothetical protein